MAYDGIISAGGLFQWRLADSTETKHYSLKKEDYPGLPLFDRMAPSLSKTMLNHMFWLVLDDISTWRSMSALYHSVAEMDKFARSAYDAVPEALGGACPKLNACPKISKTMVAYLSGLAIVAPYYGGASDKRASGLAEEHADIVMRNLQPVTADAYVEYLARKLVEWYSESPRTERHPPPATSDADGHPDREGEGEGEAQAAGSDEPAPALQ